MRLIDADELYKHKLTSASERMDLDVVYMGGWNDAIDSIVENAPTLDAVEVVRCENCRWFGEEDEDGHCWCNFNDISTLKHSFCSHGERRKDE